MRAPSEVDTVHGPLLLVPGKHWSVSVNRLLRMFYTRLVWSVRPFVASFPITCFHFFSFLRQSLQLPMQLKLILLPLPSQR